MPPRLKPWLLLALSLWPWGCHFTAGSQEKVLQV